MPKLFSYIVDHDYGFAPNPFGGLCTLAKCKFRTTKRNIVEMAEEGDWIAGTGGADLEKSAGHGKLIYAMRVDEKISLAEYCEGNNGNRIDAEHDLDAEGRFALLSWHFFYFGRSAIDISTISTTHLTHGFEKSGPGYRRDFSEAFIEDFTTWLTATFRIGVHGIPCKPHSELRKLKCPSKIRRVTEEP